jgi:hemolysin III
VEGVDFIVNREPEKEAPMAEAKANSYSLAEEIASSITHGIGAVLGVAALVVLVVLGTKRGDAWHVVSVAVYGSTLVLLYLFSTLYHAFQQPRIKKVLRHFDHSAIYLLIAGTYTPFTLVNMRGPWGWSMFGIIWGLALLGLCLNFTLMGRSRILAGLVYIGMGWLVVVAAKPLMATVAPGGIAWLVAGGLAYTFGVIFYVWKTLPFNHAIWHLFVMAGSVCHFFAILFYVIPG